MKISLGAYAPPAPLASPSAEAARVSL